MATKVSIIKTLKMIMNTVTNQAGRKTLTRETITIATTTGGIQENTMNQAVIAMRKIQEINMIKTTTVVLVVNTPLIPYYFLFLKLRVTKQLLSKFQAIIPDGTSG